MRKLTLWMMPFLLLLTLSLGAAQADLIQCTGAACDGTINADLMNGTDLNDEISGLDGDDAIFANGGNDDVFGGMNNDIIFGGNDDDNLRGNDGNDTLLAGPDIDQNSAQATYGNEGTDTSFVFAGETQGCLFVDGGDGRSDVANLIGFGPYSATVPFGQSGFGNAFVLVIDPITGGQVFISVFETDEGDTEIIHGLPSPNVTLVGFDDLGNCQQFE